MARIYTVAQAKGGVGKTTVAVNLAAVAAEMGRSTLLVDTDPQFAATRRAGAYRDGAASLVDVLAEETPAADVLVRGVHGFDVLPAHRRLNGVSGALEREIGRERYLARALAPLDRSYDVMVIDTPPNLDLLTVNALFCADVVVAPVSGEDEGAAQGSVELRAVLQRVVSNLRPEAPLTLVAVMTRWLENREQARDIAEAMERFDIPVVARMLTRVDVQKADARRVPFVIQHAPSATDAAEQLRELGRALFDGPVAGQRIEAQVPEGVA